MDLKKGLAYSVIIFALFAVSFMVANTVVGGLQPAAYDAFWQPKVVALQAFFGNGYTVIFVAWITNISGLAIMYAKLKAEAYPEITYNAWKFYGTLALILGAGVTLFSTLPPPFGQIALALSAVIKILETSFTKVLPAPATSGTTVAATGPGPPS